MKTQTNTKALQWITGNDTGTSSKKIWALMMADGYRKISPHSWQRD